MKFIDDDDDDDTVVYYSAVHGHSPCKNKSPSTEGPDSCERFHGITVNFVPRPRGTAVQLVPVPAVSPWGLSPLPWSNRGYRGVTVIPIPVQLSIAHVCCVDWDVWGNGTDSQCGCFVTAETSHAHLQTSKSAYAPSA